MQKAPVPLRAVQPDCPSSLTVRPARLSVQPDCPSSLTVRLRLKDPARSGTPRESAEEDEQDSPDG